MNVQPETQQSSGNPPMSDSRRCGTGELMVVNAVIESASIGLDRGFILSGWVFLDYGGGCQGFGGYVLGGMGEDCACANHAGQPNLAAEFIVGVLKAAGVEKWGDLPGKTLRVQKTGHYGDIVAIGHVIKDDCWFNPKERFAAMLGRAEVTA